MEFGFEPVCDQLRTSLEPASVMEFGFKQFQMVCDSPATNTKRFVALIIKLKTVISILRTKVKY